MAWERKDYLKPKDDEIYQRRIDEEKMETIRKNERYYRLKAGLSGKKIGELTGHSDSWIVGFEHHTIKALREKDLQKVAEILGVTIKELEKPAGHLILSVTDEENATGVENLEKIRKHRKLTQTQFCELTGIPLSYYLKVLSGTNKRFGVRSWWKIADALRMNLKILIGRE